MDEAPTTRGVLTPRWILVHIAVVVLVVTFLLLGWWQFGRAARGNLLSYGYAIQWPAFAVFVVYVWIKEMRRVIAPSEPARTAQRPGPPPVRTQSAANRRPAVSWDDSEDEELAAYNHYLAWLNANPHLSPSKYPGRS